MLYNTMLTISIILFVTMFLPWPIQLYITKIGTKKNIYLKLFLFIKINILSGKKHKKQLKPIKEKKQKKKKKSKIQFSAIWAMINDGNYKGKLISAILGLLKGIIFSFKIKDIFANIVYGTGDPAETGMIFGKFAIMHSISSKYKNVCLNPDFLEKKLDLDVYIKITVIPAKIIFSTIIFVVSLPIYRTSKLFMNSYNK